MGWKCKGVWSRKGQNVIAGIIAFLSAWKLQTMLGMSSDTFLIESNALWFVLMIAFFFLLRQAFACQDKRLGVVSYVVGFVFSTCVSIGTPLQQNGAYLPMSWQEIASAVMVWVLAGILFGAAVLLVYQGMLRLNASKLPQKESRFSKITGNVFVLFAFFMVCWIPVWLAFWPGAFSSDSVTQFWMYYNQDFSTHHPLLHTLFLGVCVMFGMEHSIDGSISFGLGIYSVIQVALMAGIFAYACHWLRKQKAALWARIAVTLFFGLFPFYSFWVFNSQKDILFGGLTLLFLLQMVNLWQGENKGWRFIVRMVILVIISALMMLLRNNGMYALILAMPLIILWLKGTRIWITVAICASIGLALGCNQLMIATLDAEVPCKIELLSVPLQQIARTLRDYPEAIEEDTDEVILTLYGEGITPDLFYHEQISDPVRWQAYYSQVDDNLGDLFSLWIRMGLKYPQSYLEAFFVQNLPYYLPGSDMLYNFMPEVKVNELEIFPVEIYSYFPELKEDFLSYHETLTFYDIPGVTILTDVGFYVWLSFIGFGYAWYKKQKHWMACFAFLFAIWISCLAGPVAIMRYMLSFYYAIPILLVVLIKPTEKMEG